MDLRDPDIDFVGMAKAMGVNAQHITRAEDIAPGVQAGMNASGPTLLDVRVADGYGG
jgi:benzoylformate decarboxylase